MTNHLNRVELPLYEARLRNFLPDTIYDIHVHLGRKGDFRPISDERRASNPGFIGKPLSGVVTRGVFQSLLPGKRVEMLCFPIPFREAYLDRVNEHLAMEIAEHCVQGLMTPPIGTSKAELARQLDAGHFLGFKPYPDFVDWKPERDVRIADYVTQEQLELADERGLIIMLHLPRPGRLPDPVNQEDLRAIARRYRNAKLVVAHIGRSYCPGCAEEGLTDLVDLPNLYFDTAFVMNSEVFKLALQRIDHSRLIFGSDFPICLFRGRHVCENGSPIWVTNKRYLCPRIHQVEGDFVFALYESLLALQTAIEELAVPRRTVEAIFYGNGKRLVESVPR